RRHTRCLSDWSSDVCSSDLASRSRSKGSGWRPETWATVTSQTPCTREPRSNAHHYGSRVACDPDSFIVESGTDPALARNSSQPRSEERRVGKEYRTRGSRQS